jgi:hypothetical protein
MAESLSLHPISKKYTPLYLDTPFLIFVYISLIFERAQGRSPPALTLIKKWLSLDFNHEMKAALPLVTQPLHQRFQMAATLQNIRGHHLPRPHHRCCFHYELGAIITSLDRMEP